ncbi:LytR/AlgR family response regulator transcription factor [Thermodesulfobacteriota bacterium]
MPLIKAIIADDEQTLRASLLNRLQKLWPELYICGEAANGLEALELIRKEHPDIAFLDIRMPGLSGLEVAKQCPESCRVVFITAYDQYAVEAFENSALDYLLKPVKDVRLKKMISRLQKQCSAPNGPKPDLTGTVEKLLQSLESNKAREYLQWIRAQTGETLKLIPVTEVCYFQASDKYTVVMTPTAEYLIRVSIKQLAEELDPNGFWRIHRKTIVNLNDISRVGRSITGRYEIHLTRRPETLIVSRSYSHLFKQM